MALHQVTGAAESKASVDTAASARSKKDYLDTLVPPSQDEIRRIAGIQILREREGKRRSHEAHKEKGKEERRSMDVSRHSLDSRRSRGSIRRSRDTSVTHAAIASATAAAGSIHNIDDLLSHRAATLIQRTYRGYRTRRAMKGLTIDASTRWNHALKEMQFRAVTQPRARSPGGGDEGRISPGKEEGHGVLDQPTQPESGRNRSNTARSNWRKVATIARRAGGDMDDDPSSDSSEDDSESDTGGSMTSEKKRKAHQRREEAKARRRKDAKMMGLQYFLEMVDLKHRYGSNLRTYHEEWKNADTNENFFYWLDYGDGLNIEMASCPRERLDREQVRYLSREERQYYLAKVDSEGRLCWAKNGARIDTTENWKDSIHGIVPSDDPTPAFQAVANNTTDLQGDESGSDSDRASESELEAARAAKYANPGLDDVKGMKKVTHISASTIFNTLLRKSVKKNTWIFVADTSFRLYVGIKNSGAFQHSSFVQGSRISAAGLIKIKNGRLASLSPLSGHYRPPASNFRAFEKSLKEEGVDMSHVSISKSYAVLVGLEAYMKTRQKGKEFLKKLTHQKDKVIHPEVAQKRIEDAKDKSQSAETERQFLEKQEKSRDENKATAQLMQKLRIVPTVPSGQKGDLGDDGAEEQKAGAEAAQNTQTSIEK